MNKFFISKRKTTFYSAEKKASEPIYRVVFLVVIDDNCLSLTQASHSENRLCSIKAGLVDIQTGQSRKWHLICSGPKRQIERQIASS